MVDITLIITAVVFAILVMIASFYFIVYYQHPQDKSVAWFPKSVVVATLSLACWNLFLLPLQVANSTGVTSTSGIPMEKLTLGFYATSVIMILVMVPFTVYFYEGEDGEEDENGQVKRTSAAQFGYAIKYIIPTILVFAAIVAGMYYGGLGYAAINTTYLQSPLYDTTALEATSLDSFFSFSFYCNSSANNVAITLNPKVPVFSGIAASTFTPSAVGNTNKPDFGCASVAATAGLTAICCSTPVVNSVVVSPLVFIVAVLTLLGWVVFSIFCGVGMASLPYDWLNEFKHRPKPITVTQYQSRKKQVGEQAALLMDEYRTLNEELKQASRGNSFNKKYRAIKNKENSFRKNVMILDYHYRNLEDGYKFQGGNLILQYTKFIAAIFSAILTLLWIVHSILYVVPQELKNKGQAINVISPFLNDMLKLTSGVPVVGIVLYTIFVFYLMACVVKGNAKLGMRIIFFTIHPLIFGETMMSAMVFNAGIILLCSLPLCSFAQTAFASYASSSANQSIFGVQISSITAFAWGYDVFIYVMLGFIAMTFIYQMYNPFKKQKENQLSFKWDE